MLGSAPAAVRLIPGSPWYHAALPIVFSRSVRSLESDGYRRSGLTFAVAFSLAGAWIGWFLLARVAVIEVAETARLEVDQMAHNVEAPLAGVVTMTHLLLGQKVAAGDVLVELDAEPLRMSLNQEKANQASFAPQLAALAHELEAGEQALEEHRGVAQARLDESAARRREAENAAQFADDEMTRSATLHAEGLASKAEASKAKADADQRRAVAQGALLTGTRIQSEERAAETERRANLARLRREISQLEGQRAISAATIEKLEYEIGRRQIRSPVDGRLGEVAVLRAGAVVKEGDRLGAIIPSGAIRIVAEYLPASAVGRIRPGQSARMRPDGFPWTQYGMLAATVSRVANEPRSGLIRVELDVPLRPGSLIPMQHGLPGTLEIEVERASPAELVLRAAGRRLAAPMPTTETRSDVGEGASSAPPRP
jgi:membrane fusion protein (multidrug efflux system)